MNKLRWIFIFVILLLSACGSEKEHPTPTELITSTSTKVQTETREYVLTETVTPNLIAANTSTVTNTPTALPDFFQTYLYSYGWINPATLLVTIENVPPLPEGVVLNVFVDDVAFSCNDVDDYPNRLYCQGPSNNSAGSLVLVEAYLEGLDEPIWKSELQIPWLNASSTSTPATGSDGNNNGPCIPIPDWNYGECYLTTCDECPPGSCLMCKMYNSCDDYLGENFGGCFGNQ